MKLLLVTDAVGGVWVYSLELARALQPLGVETILAVMGPAPSDRHRAEAAGLKLIDTGLPLDWLDCAPAELRRAGEALAEIARHEGADMVQTCSAALLADAAFAQPCIAVQHSCVATWWAAVKGTPLPHEFAWRRELVECGLHRANAIVAPSVAFAADTARAYAPSRPVLAVHNGRRPVAPPALPQGAFAFSASRLWDEGKNVATLDKAAAALEVPFLAAGPMCGPNGASVQFQHLDCIGELSATRLSGLLAARPLFASAAVYEPFGLSVAEAAFAGCALVLSDIPTHRELWRNVAVFVPAHDADGFAEAIRLLFDDLEAREVLGKAARERALHYSPERMAARMAEIYREVAAQPARTAEQVAA